jgi:Fe-S-cluster containining protein
LVSTQAAATETHVTVRVHLRVLDVDREFYLSVPVGPRRLVELLPVARELSDQLTTMALEKERAAGRSVSCRAGCGACCRQLVAISLVEAQGLAELVDRLPPERQALVRDRFTEAVQKLEQVGLLDAADPHGQRNLRANDLGNIEASVHDVGVRYFAQNIACPFLEDESCSIYEERPSVCREYHVTSPAEHCVNLYVDDVESVPVPRRVGDSLMKAAHDTAGLPTGKMPLTLSLEWSAANADTLSHARDGLDLFKGLMNEL